MPGFLQTGADTVDFRPLLRQRGLSCEVHILHKFYKAFISNILHCIIVLGFRRLGHIYVSLLYKGYCCFK